MFGHRLRWALVLVGVVVVALVGYTGWQALQARHDLEQVSADFQSLSSQLTSGDQDAAQQTLVLTQEHANAARRHTRGPGWWLAVRVPGVGPNVDAVRTVADLADNLSTQVLPDVVDATGVLRPDRMRPTGGRIDLAPISEVAPRVVRAAGRLTTQSNRAEAIDTSRLLPQVAVPVRRLQDRLRDAAVLTGRASRAVQLLPPMLGAGSERTYLMFFQNNAELRSTGGLPGSFATVRARDGKVTMGNQGSASSVGSFDRPPTELTAEERVLFGPNMGVLPQDTNFTPDFPRTAQLLAAMWNARHADKVDGVLSTDPVALSLLLRGTGPVGLPGGVSLTAQDAVGMLLNQVYAQIADPAQQDGFFKVAAKSVFDAVSSGQGEPKAVLASLVTATEQRRIMLWSGNAREQALLAPTRLGGSLTSPPSSTPHIGVFLNNGGGSKLDYFLDHRVDVTSSRCQAGRQHLTVTLGLRSQVPADPGGLSDSIAKNAVGIPRGLIRITLFVYAPAGGYLDAATYDGQQRELAERTHDGRTVVAQTVDVEPGSKHTLTYRMVTAKGQTARTDLQVTPGARSDGMGTVGPSAC
jgi:hypothetical protein